MGGATMKTVHSVKVCKACRRIGWGGGERFGGDPKGSALYRRSKSLVSNMRPMRGRVIEERFVGINATAGTRRGNL